MQKTIIAAALVAILCIWQAEARPQTRSEKIAEAKASQKFGDQLNRLVVDFARTGGRSVRTIARAGLLLMPAIATSSWKRFGKS